MRTTNPMLSRLTDAARATVTAPQSERMTIAGTSTKAAILLAIVLITAFIFWTKIDAGRPELLTPSLLIGGIGGFVVALITIFKPQTAPWTAPLYASLQGVFLGAVSALYNMRFAGLPQQAVVLTFAVAFTVFVLYRANILRATQGFRRMMIAATVGIGVFYLGSMLLSLFGVSIGYFTSSSPLAIGVNVIIAGVAALNLVLDFDRIEEGVRAGAPRALEWFAAFGLMVTLVWLYLELLRLLSRLQGRRD